MDSRFHSSAGFEGLLQQDFLTVLLIVLSAGLTLIGVFLVLMIIVIRILHARRVRWLATFRARFQPILFEAMLAPVTIQLNSRRERIALMALLDETQQDISGEESDNLNRLVRDLELDQEAMRCIAERSMVNKLLGIRVISRAGVIAAWPMLEALALGSNQMLALAASHALVLLDPKRAFAIIAPVLRRGSQWAPVEVIRILRDGGEYAREALGALLENAAADEAVLLVRLLQQTQDSAILPVLRARLLRARVPEETGELLLALGRLGTAEDRQTVLTYLGDSNWIIRLKAVRALGLIGVAEDRNVLLALLRDEQWWVRYAAAQSLVSLPGSSIAFLQSLRRHQADRFAADILKQVIAEQVGK